jgi:hypothetical protein
VSGLVWRRWLVEALHVASKQAFQLFCLNGAVGQYLSQQSQTQRSAAHRNDSCPAIRMPEKAVTSSYTFHREPRTLERADEFLTRGTRESAHAATVTL